MKYIKKEYNDKIEYYNEKGLLHREDGPAIEWSDGSKGYKWWYINGERHRQDGPAVETTSGYKQWYLNDTLYLEKEWEQEVTKIKLKRILDL